MQGGKYKKSYRIDGKIVVITGSNTGIGKETALELAKRGGIIYMACRDLEKADKACYEIQKNTGNQNIFVKKLDLTSFESIRNFIDDFQRNENRIDILINNAGYFGGSLPSYTKEGIEMTMAVNHFGHFLLTNLMLDMLKRSEAGRVIVVSSGVHIFGSINKTDLNYRKNWFNWFSYNQSKLANILFANELSRRLQDTKITVNSVHPGFIHTDIRRNVGILQRLLATIIFYPFEKSIKSGAQTTIYAALEPGIKNVTGKYFEDCKEVSTSKSATDEKLAKWLWDESARVTRLSEN